MVRILHIIDADADFQTRRCAEELLRGLGEGFDCRLMTIGPGGNWRGLAQAVRGLRGERGIDLLHAWGGRALTAAAIGSQIRIVHTVGAEMRPPDARWLRAVMHCRDLQVICPSGTLRRALLNSGIQPERCHLLRPGVDFARVNRRKDPTLRAALGFDPDDCVLLGVGESTAAACHEDAVWAAGILHVLDERYRLLLWGRGPRVGAVGAFARAAVPPGVLHWAQPRLGRRIEFENLLGAADLIVNTACRPAATLPLMIGMAAALPIVSTVTSTAAELLEHRHTAVLAPKHAPRLLAQRIVELRDDPSLQWTISDHARSEAYRFFPLTRFLEQHRTLYRQLAERGTVRLTEPCRM